MADPTTQNVKDAVTAVPRDLEPLIALLSDDVEWDYVGAFPESKTYYGPDGVRQFLREWIDAFDEFEIEVEETVDTGDHIVAGVRQRGRGKGTGAAVENFAWQLFSLRDAKIVHCRGYDTKAEAIEAARD